jgi:hypothetical protein
LPGFDPAIQATDPLGSSVVRMPGSEPNLFRPSTNTTLEARQGDWIYILTNRQKGTLYVGVTNDLARRTGEPRDGLIEGFTKRYGLNLLAPATGRRPKPRDASGYRAIDSAGAFGGHEADG